MPMSERNPWPPDWFVDAQRMARDLRRRRRRQRETDEEVLARIWEQVHAEKGHQEGEDFIDC
jgi:hypothetical protein